MLRTVTLAARVTALVVVAAAMVTDPAVHARDVAVEGVALSVAALTVGLWLVTTEPVPTSSARARLAGLVPYAAAAMIVTSALASLAGNGGPFSLLDSIAIVWAGSSLSLAAAGVLTGAGMLAIWSAGLVFDVGAWDLVGLPLIHVLGLLFGRLLCGYRIQAEQAALLLAKAELLRQEQARAATLDERNRIAREIHDVLAHSLGALGVQIQAAQAVLTDQRDVDRAVELLQHARAMASQGLEETRQALHALRADTPELPQGLADLSAAHQRRYRAAVTLQVTGTPRPLPADAGLALTRTAQEALINSAKYAPHEPVEIRLDYTHGHTALTVANKWCAGGGTGDPGLETANGGYGLAGMRERLLLVNGHLDAEPADGRWVVSAEVPQ